MANQKYFDSQDQDPVGALWQQNAWLQKRVSDLERQVDNSYSVTAIPRIDPVTYPNPYEGQRAIDEADEQHTWYSNGEWRKAASSGAQAMVKGCGLLHPSSYKILIVAYCPALRDLNRSSQPSR